MQRIRPLSLHRPYQSAVMVERQLAHATWLRDIVRQVFATARDGQDMMLFINRQGYIAR